MSRLTIDGAAFYGFGLIRRDPLTFLGVALLLAILGATILLVVVPAYLQFVSLVVDASQTGREPPPEVVAQAMIGLLGAIGPLYLLAFPVYMMMIAALHRSLVFGKSKGWVLGLKLGMDELRAFCVLIVCAFVACLPYFAALVLTMVVAGVLAAAAAGGGGEGAALVALPVMFLGVIAGVGATIWIAVRLSYALPATVGERRFVIFESWAMTKGKFWTLFLAYLVVIVLIYVIEMLVFAVVAVFAWGWIASVDWESFDASSLAAFSIGPVAAVLGAIAYGVLATFISGALYGVASRGYLAWKEENEQTAAAFGDGAPA